ncbi:hypothetical protein LEP1GSC178_2752 [Leptospira licerasiae str. MMD4847]|uniref:Uncharacterized protein n=1 Tax=Leptospira licerasiae str. MMD4847 TaxID=1049971 RepID=A0ABN0HBJ8_9LEPT|nr:hypothetical protein LEP1GSC178_2752 [Leptospira licerasiae str. MMD4847]
MDFFFRNLEIEVFKNMRRSNFYSQILYRKNCFGWAIPLQVLS